METHPVDGGEPATEQNHTVPCARNTPEDPRTDPKPTLSQHLEQAKPELTRLKDELKLQVHLGKQDAKDLWGSLEPALHKAEQRLDNAARAINAGADEARVQTHLGIADLKKKWPSMERGVADVIDDIKRAAAGARTELDTARVKAHLAGLDAESLGEVAAKELKETAQELDRQSEAAVVDLKKSFTDLKKRLTT